MPFIDQASAAEVASGFCLPNLEPVCENEVIFLSCFNLRKSLITLTVLLLIVDSATPELQKSWNPGKLKA
jgi:hypothetical protein